MPELQVIQIQPTRFHPFAPVLENESSDSGNIAIQEDYELRQCGLDPDDNEKHKWDTILRPYYGDLKTVLRMISCQDMRRMTAANAYDKKEWLIPGLGLWHLRFHLLKLIHSIHWGKTHPPDSSTLQWQANAWYRSNVLNPNHFEKLENLCIHSYQARITGLLFHIADKDFASKEAAEKWLSGRRKAGFQGLIDRLIALIYPTAWNRFDNLEPPPLNSVWFNHQCFLRHMDVYFMLKHAIKYADIGLLRCALRETCVMFQAKEARKHLYGPELLRLLHLYDSLAADRVLQEAMLINGLVNLSGQRDKNFEMDRLNEMLNAMMAIGKRDRLSSTKPLKDLLDQIALTAPYMQKLKQKVDGQFGKIRSTNHPPNDASEDLWHMAKDLARLDFKQKDGEVFSASEAHNLIALGYQCLGENVLKYNEKIASGLGIPDDLDDQDDLARPEGPQLQDSLAIVTDTILFDE